MNRLTYALAVRQQAASSDRPRRRIEEEEQPLSQWQPAQGLHDHRSLLAAQRSIGNAAVSRLVRGRGAPLPVQRHVSGEQINAIRVDTSKFAKKDIATTREGRTMQTVTVTAGRSSVEVEYEAGNKKIFEQIDALRTAMGMVERAGYALPAGITIHFPTVAHPGMMSQAYEVIDEDPDGEAPEPTQEMILMPNYSTIQPARKGSEKQYGIAGGVTAGGRARGVADSIAEKVKKDTWFNSSKKARRAMATAVIVHELGHILHTTMSPDKFYDAKKNPGDYKIGTVAPDVSEYALSSPVEFVAEVFTGMVHGRRYSEDVMRKYADLHGPTPPEEEIAEHSDHEMGIPELIPRDKVH